ncbi:MAG: PAS domain S-box protein [Candidatus Helarchaeota archaeon]
MKELVDAGGLEECFQLLIDIIDDLLVGFRSDGKLFYLSPQIKDVLGYEQGDLSNKNIFDYIHPGDRSKIFENYNNLVQKKKKKVSFDIQVKHKNGNYKVLSAKIGVLERNNKTFLIGLVRDITEHVKNEAALYESELKYQDLYNKAPIAYFSVGIDGKIKRANKAAQDFIGYNLTELQKMNIFDLYSKESRIKAQQLFEKFKQGVSWEAEEMSYINKNGEKIYGLLSVNPVKNEKGEIIESRSVVVNITEQKKAENALKKSEEKYQLITENANDMIAVLSKDFKFEYINERAYNRILGYQYSDLLGKSPLEFIFPEDQKKVLSIYKKSFEEGFGEAEFRFRKKDGKYVWIEVRGRTFIDSDGVTKALIISRDISERKEMEQTKERYLRDLEKEVKIRTNELLQSEKLASIGLLASGVAHEINNPITGIINYAKIIKEKLAEYEEINLNSRPFSFLNGIIKEGERIAKIVNDLLLYARKDQGTYVYDDITKIIKSAIDLLLLKFKYYQIEFDLHFQNQLPKIPIRPQNIQQVILNILQNSIDALNEKFGERSKIGLKKIEIKISDEEINDKKFVKILVKDNGTGIKPENLKKIFDPFFTTKKYSKEYGTGLGLSISYRIIRDHGGKIEFRSKQGEWTVVEILLPINR